MPKVGRPKKDPQDRRDFSFRLRMTEEEFNQLNWLAEKTGFTRSEVIRMGLAMFEGKVCDDTWK